MTNQEVINEIAGKFKDEWDENTYHIEWPNTKKKSNAIPYVRLNVVFFDTDNAVIGGAKQRYSGLIVISIFVAANVGYGLAYSIAELVFGIFQNKQFSGLFTYAGTSRVIGKDPEDSNLFMLNAQIPFEAI